MIRRPRCPVTVTSDSVAAGRRVRNEGRRSDDRRLTRTPDYAHRVKELLLAWYARERARSALAEDEGSVRHPGLRGDAAADAGRAGGATVGGVARALADGGVARGRARRGGDRRLAGPRLQPPGGEPAPSGTGGRDARVAHRPHRASRRRPVHRGGGRQLRVRRRRAADRREHRPHPGAHRRELRCLLRAGALRPRRDRLPRPRSALRRVPARRRMPVAWNAVRAAAEAVAIRGLVPSAAGRDAAHGRSRRAATDEDALRSLARDGLVVLRDGVASLPV